MMLSPASTFRQLLEEQSEKNSSKSFAIFPEYGTDLSFLSLHEASRDFALQLARSGLIKGDRFAILSRNGKFLLTALFGGLYGGFIPVPVNSSAGPSEIEYILNHSQPKLLFATADHQDLVKTVQNRIPEKTFLVPADTHEGVRWRNPFKTVALPQLGSEDDALLIYTSGSTGTPKGALHSHRTLIASALNTIRMYGLKENDRSYCALPMYHMNALNVSILPSFLSAGSVLLPCEFKVHSFWKNVYDYRCSWFSLVPNMVSSLLAQDEAPSKPSSVIRFARCSSAPLSPILHSQFENRFNIPLVEAMGSTETAATIFSNPLPPGKRKSGSPGLSQGWEIQIRNESGKVLPSGEKGEVWMRGRAHLKEYYKDEIATASIHDSHGWFSLGDLGRVDEEGYFYFSGKKSDLINKGGEKIAPSEIELALQQHPFVLEAACTGRKDENEEIKIIACVVVRPDCKLTEGDLLRFCEKTIGPYRTPDRIAFVPELPRSPSGKLLRGKLPVI